MTGPSLLFNCFVVLAFGCSILDHWFAGRGYILAPLRALLLGCFVFTEAFLAITAQPMMWLYVALNLWGLVNLYAGRKSPLRVKSAGLRAQLTSSEETSGDATTVTQDGHPNQTSD